MVDQSGSVTTSEQQAVPVAQSPAEHIEDAINASFDDGAVFADIADALRIAATEISQNPKVASLPCKSGEGAEARLLAVEVALQSIISLDNHGDGARSYVAQRGCIARIKAIARDGLAALRPSDSGSAMIPGGMKAWHGGDEAPADWDGGAVWRDDAAFLHPHPNAEYDWHHPPMKSMPRILAYTPVPDATQTREAEGDVVHDIASETVCGFRVAAYRETHPEHGDKYGHTYSEHWSTPNTRNPAVRVERLFTEAQLREALATEDADQLLDVLAERDNLVLFNGTQADGYWEVRRGSLTGEIRGRGPTPKYALRAALNARGGA